MPADFNDYAWPMFARWERIRDMRSPIKSQHLSVGVKHGKNATLIRGDEGEVFRNLKAELYTPTGDFLRSLDLADAWKNLLSVRDFDIFYARVRGEKTPDLDAALRTDYGAAFISSSYHVETKDGAHHFEEMRLVAFPSRDEALQAVLAFGTDIFVHDERDVRHGMIRRIHTDGNEISDL